MNTKTIAILGVAAVVSIGLAALITRGSSEPAGTGTFFPGLADRINDVAQLQITRAGDEFAIRRAADTWELVEKGGYPVRLDRVRETVVGLADLRDAQAMTARADRYAQIGVQDIEHAEPGAAGGPTLLTLKDDAGEVLATAIIGNSRFGARPGVYIRRPGEEQSWLAEGRLEIPGQFTGWIEPQIMSISRDRVKSVDITPADEQPFSVERTQQDRDYTLIGTPEGREVENTAAINAFGSALSFLSLEDVAPAGSIDFTGGAGGTPSSQLDFRTFDGLLITVKLTEQDGRTWARIAAAPDPQAEPSEAAIAEAEQLSTKLDGWAFGLPPYKASVMKVTMEDLLRDGRPLELPASMMQEGIETLDLSEPVQPPQAPGSP